MARIIYIKDTKDEVAYKSKINMMCAIYPENYEEPPKKQKTVSGEGESSDKSVDEDSEKE